MKPQFPISGIYIPTTLQKGYVQIHNIERQKIITTGEIIKALEKIPDYHFKGLKAIFYDPDKKFQCNFSLAGYRITNLRAIGEYNHISKFVIIYRCINKTDFISTMYHEIGHHVYSFVLDTKLRQEWVANIYQSGSKLSGNAKEDFAEMYAKYAINPISLQFYREKFIFMRDCIFS